MKKKNPEPTPEVAAPQPAPAEDLTRNIYVFGRLENEVALPVIKKLLRLNEKDPNKPINLYINSSGGNGYNADAIIATMHSIEAKVNTICLGHALSGACEILASATGERSAYEFATLMFHQTLWEADGDITNLEIQAAQGLRFREAQIELLHRCTGKDKAVVRKDIERDHYMSSREALEYGIIDKIIKHKGSNQGRLRDKNSEEKSVSPAKMPASKLNGKGTKIKSAAKVMKKSTRAQSGRGR